MLIITVLTFCAGYYFISKQQTILQQGILESKQTYIASQKELIKREVDVFIQLSEFKLNEAYTKTDEFFLKQELLDWARNVRFGKKNDSYLFIYAIEDINGGDKFAKMLVNANRPDLEGKYISDSYKDADGKEFRKIFLDEIRKKGSSYVTYMYKKPNSLEVRPKISYFRLYKKYNWVIAAGVYLDDIDVQIAQKQANLKRNVQVEITSAIIIFLFFSLIANAFAIFLGKRIEIFLKNYNDEVKHKTKELEEFNKNLSLRVSQEVTKVREQEQIIIQKSKFIALGEMISNIAHQWRQPLSELSAIMMTLKLRYNLGKMDNEIMNAKSHEAEMLLEYMSKTIDDFKEFFMPAKEKKEFYLKDAIEASMNIIRATTKHRNIIMQVDIDEKEKIYGYKNEFEQVILNILTNAKQILYHKQIPNSWIKIQSAKSKHYTIISIEDNAGGITVEPLEKIFEPYFTTKEQNGGTGIGLYMSKIIIEKNMGGILSVSNTQNGAKFVVKIKRI
ncbi:MAG: cache domain-containing protein [Sulfurospirillum sp.]|nr:cache domain-containing protein [Sulfurospirillum sp.]